MEEQLLQQSDWVAPEARHAAACDEHVGIRWPAVASVFGVASHIGRGPGGGVGGSDEACSAWRGMGAHSTSVWQYPPEHHWTQKNLAHTAGSEDATRRGVWNGPV